MKQALLLLFLAAGAANAMAADNRRSGYDYMSPSTQAMQRDDSQNPAMLWVATGKDLWAKNCASCHSIESMKGKAAAFPKFSQQANKVITLAGQVNQCRQRQEQPPYALESDPLLSLEAYIAMQSRGLPQAPPQDEQTQAAVKRGAKLYTERIGQLNLSCAQCHDNNAGKRLAGAIIPQGHANAYPIYRLEWQALGSLQRRLRNCMNGVRAEVPPYGAPELIDLEAYLAQRAQGMPLETPGVRP